LPSAGYQQSVGRAVNGTSEPRVPRPTLPLPSEKQAPAQRRRRFSDSYRAICDMVQAATAGGSSTTGGDAKKVGGKGSSSGSRRRSSL
jgi:hypothetical protein